MIFAATRLDGAWLIDIDKRTDERGLFARTSDPHAAELRCRGHKGKEL
jgi:dTDP-4-dehydrorhamnose 3,5-epimerase-like enzyme